MASRSARTRHRAPRGFTLIELLITVLVLATVVITLTTVMYTASRSKTSSANSIEASQAGRVALDLIARDLRSAGYGADLDYTSSPQPAIAYIDSLQVLINANLQPYPDTASSGHASPVAYNPSGSPKPCPLNGTTWEPPVKYGSGAEVIRWTLDLTNDGLVNAADVASANGIDARRTPNPDDYELVRQVYGETSSGNNGGVTQRVALLRPPGSGVPPLFTVYMKGSSTPYDWASGPVPAAQLRNIERITVRITAPSGKPDWRGRYAESRFSTEVNSLRNVPDFGPAQYGVDGYVYNDLDKDRVKDVGEPGLPGAVMKLGTYSVTTSSTGYFLFPVPAGTYWLTEYTTPAGYVNFSSPESLSVTVPPATTRSFPNVPIEGGIIHTFVFVDADNDGAFDAGETGRSAVKVVYSPAARTQYTDVSGQDSAFTSVGSYTVTVTAPDSFIVTTTNPVTGTMTDGGSESVSFGIYRAAIGTIRGTVFRDNNRNQTQDMGEGGFEGVWVGVTTDGGLTVPGYAYTDASGNYSVTVPINDPPHTTPYSVMCIPPAGFFPTTSMSINGVWLQDGQTLTGQSFGVAGFQVITLNATRVLCLASRDLIEKDWKANKTDEARGDEDIILGSDTGGADQISVWFDQYNATPLFNADATYTRSAPNAVLSMAVDALDQNTPFAERPDLVTGTKVTASGNFFVWLTQGSSGNEGYFTTSYSTGQNYKTTDQGDVQAVVTPDCAGGAGADMPDIVVGTKSPTANLGTIEVWKNSNAVTPAFSREEVYPPAGGTTGFVIGEVTAIATADIDGDGKKDLVVGTRRGDYSGQVLFFKGANKNTTPHFTFMSGFGYANDAFTSLAITDVDGDGNLDVVAGSQNGSGTGRLIYLRDTNPATFSFAHTKAVDAPGVVTALLAADYGGSSRNDIAIGWRQSGTSYVGGVRIYFTDAGTLPNLGVDPSAGTLANFVPALTANNFNYGVYPSGAPTPYLADLAAGVKISSTMGALVVFIR